MHRNVVVSNSAYAPTRIRFTRDDHRLAAVISLASPHRGTQLARYGIGESARDMTPGSAHMNAYPPSRIGPVPVHTLISGADNIVAPPWSTVLMEGDNVLLDLSVGHVAPLYLEDVAEQVNAWVESAPTPTPPDETRPAQPEEACPSPA